MTIIEKLRAAEAAATPGPWRVDPSYNCDIQTTRLEIASTHHANLPGGEKPRGTIPQDNATLIALARTHLPALLAVCDAAKEFADAQGNERDYDRARAALDAALAALTQEAPDGN